MQTERREFFIRHDFSFYDCGILGIFPHTMFLLYDLLHRFVWRGETSDGEVEAAQGDGYLIAKVSRRTLAEMLGFVRPQTISDHLRTLKAIGWIRVRYSEDGGSPIYLLGESVYDTAGGRHEVFYARAILGDLVDHLYALAREHRGQNATLHALSYRDRVAATESWLRSKNLFPVPASDPSDPFNGWEEGEGVSLPREGGSRLSETKK